MGAALLVCRVLLAAVFVVAGAAKLADLEGSRRAVREFGVPDQFAGLLGALLPVAEVAVGVALLITPAARFGAVGAGVLLLAFIAAIATALSAGREPDCHCFGQVHSAPAGPRTLARNLVLLGLAGFVAIGGWKHPGVSATHWTGQLPAAWLVAIVAGVVILALVSFQAWFSLQLLSQNGRALSRLEAVEAALGEIRGTLGLANDVEVGPLGSGLSGGGLAVGAPAPSFELAGVDGESYSLERLLLTELPVMLVFSAAGCGPCDSLMPELAAWQRQHARSLTIAVVADGEQNSNRAKAAERGLTLVLLQSDREVAEAYQAYGTPMAVMIDTNGLIASPTVGGADAIATLLEQATRPTLAIRQVPSPNGNGVGPRRSPPPDTSRIGEPAPELVLQDLDDQQIELKDLYGERIVALFWNPGCGFCQRMLPELKAFEQHPPPGAPRIVVITAGDPDSVRDQQMRSTVLLDTDGAAMREFAAGGTPMGVLVGQGRIASHVAAGADAVFELIRTATVAPARNGNVR
ncbi:MAG TPA: MauE/DoxX family redox-associated membrane protein [Solirubrobacteraceae bacterium]|jgi:thiol-disulfide isomerase/thioredoxin/uncharacterized membrane protein YphA (DoxX/SURF4 family)